MDIARIATLLEPFLEQPLASSQLDQISIYIDLLLRWNARINLSAIRNPEEIVARHFGESLFLARHLFPKPHHPVPNPCHPERSGGFAASEAPAESKDPYRTTTVVAPSEASLPDPPRVVDIGSGAGFPALPLKIWAPDINLTLIESNHKKAAFLSEVARELTLTNINVITSRTETLLSRPGFAQADVVTLRAVERFETILPQAVTFLATNGTLALLITTKQIPHLAAMTRVKWHPEISVPQSYTRVLSIGVLR